MLAASGVVRVLYVDDDPGISRLVRKHLERAGYVVTVAADGTAGIALVGSGHFDVIALDHYMPGRDGLDVLRVLRAMPEAPPVIFVTAAEEPRIAVTALREGAADYVLKDVQGAFLESLSSAIHRALDQERLRREKAAAEQELRASLDRLETLAAQQAIMLREVDHRVGNSLQLITSLLGLQAAKLTDPAARGILTTAAKRVEAVSLVHRRLYTSDDLEFVRMDQYLSGLVGELRRAATADTAEQRVELRAAPVRLETDKAVPIGLIVNELVTNALKYAYPTDAPGVVRVILEQDAAGTVTLIVEDDGAGMTEPVPAKGGGLGTMIVRSMAETLRATVVLDPSHKGTRTIVRLTASG
jgi:two-component sensor histidine kinase